jgi:hypothetical protein
MGYVHFFSAQPTYLTPKFTLKFAQSRFISAEKKNASTQWTGALSFGASIRFLDYRFPTHSLSTDDLASPGEQ